ncbi:RES family NAD+ phosphorylase [Bdellovibrio sp. KM01]|uniref:RES family NAD+ phosphorylase n=1 Tax=Bdellovibrio sp. KM01 TaxID=2748865 RepID=UPI0015E9E5EE|nr:RES family NAD+ phosphorylase [Bdellovibrio sp. KM01]QLY25276.1 RES family NAD+ phosphorylase [Bdellovibrio sp. KM01]
MSYTDPKDLIFKSPSEVKAFAKWYLGTNITATPDDEFSSEQEKDDFLYRRSSRLEVEVDNLRDININSACDTSYQDQTIFRLCKESHQPLSTVGSDRKSSRFNFKESALFKNRLLYLGQDKECCYGEIFHNDYMTQCYPEFEQPRADELPRAKYKIVEYQVSVPDILVVTSSSTFKALGIPQGALKDEWFELNLNYNIPSSSQILGAIARAHGYNGILYCSVRNQTKNNLVLFEDNVGELDLVCKEISSAPFDLDAYEKQLGIRKS